MPSLSLKNVPEPVVERLRRRAAANHRSLQGELMAVVTAASEIDTPSRLTIRDILELNKARSFKTSADSVGFVREDRDDPRR